MMINITSITEQVTSTKCAVAFVGITSMSAVVFGAAIAGLAVVMVANILVLVGVVVVVVDIEGALLMTVLEVVASVEVIEASGVVRAVRSPVVVGGEVVVERVPVAALQTVVVCAIDPCDPRNINFLVAFERTQAHPESVWLKDLA